MDILDHFTLTEQLSDWQDEKAAHWIRVGHQRIRLMYFSGKHSGLYGPVLLIVTPVNIEQFFGHPWTNGTSVDVDTNKNLIELVHCGLDHAYHCGPDHAFHCGA